MPFAFEQRTLRRLLVPQPLLSLAYVLGIRAQLVEPSFVPVLILGLLPLIAVISALTSFTPRRWGVLTIGLFELGWAVMTLAIVGFAIALRSG